MEIEKKNEHQKETWSYVHPVMGEKIRNRKDRKGR